MAVGLCVGPSGLYNKNWVAYKNNRNVFLTVQETGKLKALADSASGEGPLPGSWAALLLNPSLVEGMRQFSGVPFIKALMPLTGAPSS